MRWRSNIPLLLDRANEVNLFLGPTPISFHIHRFIVTLVRMRNKRARSAAVLRLPWWTLFNPDLFFVRLLDTFCPLNLIRRVLPILLK